MFRRDAALQNASEGLGQWIVSAAIGQQRPGPAGGFAAAWSVECVRHIAHEEIMLKWFAKSEPRYVVSHARQEFIRTHFFQWSFGQPESYVPDKALFLSLAHPADLHYLANIYNWDDGELVLNWILDSDLCTRATANLLFWRAAPDWYLRCDLADESTCPSYNLAGFRVLRKVLQKYRTGSFSAYSIKFDPKNEIEEVLEANPKWKFPVGVYDVIEGVDVTFAS